MTDLLAGLAALRDGDVSSTGRPATEPLPHDEDDAVAEAFNSVLDKAQRALAEYAEMRDQRVAVEQALREAIDLHRLLTEGGSDLITLIDADGTILYASPSHEAHLGLPATELVGRNAREFAHPDDVAAVGARWAEGAHDLEHEVSVRYRAGSGEWARLDAKITPVAAAVDGSRRYVVVARDVTERVRAEERLRSREARYSALAASSTDVTAVLSAQGEIIWQSPSAALFGYDPEQLRGTSVFDLIHPDDLDRSRRVLARVADEPAEPVTTEVRFRRDGGWAIRECRVTNMLDDPAVGGIVATTRDVTERAVAQQALRESERRFRAVFEGSLDAMLLADDDRVFTDVNQAACELFGLDRSEIIGRRQEEITGAPAALTAAAWREFLAAGVQAGEWPVQRADGAQRIVDYRATANILPGQHLALLRDVTERHQLEEQLRQAQKMEAVGQLAGGIAHDFNNLLTAVSGYSALLLDEHDLTNDVREQIEEIARAAGRAADLTRQLLAFSRRQTLLPTVVDPNDLVRRAAPMLRRLIDAHIDFAVEPAPGLRRVFADPSQIEQVLMNLVVNAAQAMPLGGTLTVATANVTIGDQADCVELRPGDYVEITVSDTGCGMDEETVARAFEPFFTTKGPGAGSGLGLSTVHGVAKQSGGGAYIESEPGHGTRVMVYLPATDEEVARATDTTDDDPTHGSETIILVDDEPAVREVAAEMLRRSGYEVHVATEPDEAIALAAGGVRADVLVSDVVMPKITGPDLAARLTALQPHLRTILISGYADHGLLDTTAPELSPLFLKKPFAPDALARAVRAVLEPAR